MSTRNTPFRQIKHKTDFCVVGGGMAGICAALAAARHGAKVVLMHERPMLGGNASSECRVHICGADRHNNVPDMRETGILEEIRLQNAYRNPLRNFSIWDLVLHEKVLHEPNITLLLNCTCLDAATEGSHITSVTGWQLTTQTFHTVEGAIFADCSGDGVLAPLSGAEFRIGREARNEYGESLAPEHPDNYTMGMTCYFQVREYNTPQPFDPPSFAYRFPKDSDLPYGTDGHEHGGWWGLGYWWVELGGDRDSIADTEAVRDELLKIALGVWDHIKNQGDHGADNYALDWLQFLPAKRESRRYIGDHVLTQGDIEGGGNFDDLVAYGGWGFDDHHPAGFWSVKVGAPFTVGVPTPPYGIPYRSLYSRNIDNLMFAGRDISCTHMAVSNTRVQGTGCSMGQAVGTAAALAVKGGLLPREIGNHMQKLQQLLLVDDCYLLNVIQHIHPLTMTAALSASQGDPEPVRDGVNRAVGENPHAWVCRPGDSLTFSYDAPRDISDLTLVLDSDLRQDLALVHTFRTKGQMRVPEVMGRKFRIEALNNGQWKPFKVVTNNYQRLIRLPVKRNLEGIRFVLEETWGAEQMRLYGAYVR